MNQKIEEKIKELEKMLKMSGEDIEEEPPTSLDKRILKQYEEIWKEILEICQAKKIKDMDKFDEKYPILKFGLEDFIQDYTDILDYCVQMDDFFLDTEIKMLEEVMGQFKLEEYQKQDYELLVIRDKYLVGRKKEAENLIEKWIKKHPTIGEGYEVKCDWELDKEKPNMEKIAQILEQADENNAFIPDDNIYEEVIEYFKKIGNEEMVEYYTSLLEFKQERDHDFIDNDIEAFFDEEEMFLEERQELINEIKEIANDKVEKNKKYEQYISEKKENELLPFLGPQAVFKPQEEILNIKENIREYILENYSKIIKQNMVYISKDEIQIIKQVNSNGIIEIELEECSMKELIETQSYFFLKNIGIAFIASKDTKIKVHMPLIKEMKKYIEDIQIQERHREFNEKVNVIEGICEAHGAIKAKKVYHIMEEFYGENDKEKFAKFLLLVCGILGKAGLKIDKKTGSMQAIYHNFIDEKTAKDIIKSNKEIETYTKEEYIKYSSKDFLKNTKGYKKLEKQLCCLMFYGEKLFEMLNNILIPYTIEKRLGKDDAEQIINSIIEELEELKEDILGLDINIDEIKEGFEEIANEFPKWK